MTKPASPMRLGIRGRIHQGPDVGKEVLVDSVGATPTDALVMIVSPSLDLPEHPDEQVRWIYPEAIEATLATLGIVWTDVADNQAERFL